MPAAMNVREVDEYLNVDEKTVYRLVKRGGLPGFKFYGVWRLRREDIDGWIEDQKNRGTRGVQRSRGVGMSAKKKAKENTAGTKNGGKGTTAIDQNEAVAVMLEKYEVCRGLFHGFAWSIWKTDSPTERLSLLPVAQEHVMAQEDSKNRLLQCVNELSKAFALAVPHEETNRIRDEVAFFQAVRSALAKTSVLDRRPQEEIDHAIRQILYRAVASDEVADIFAAAALNNPDISILSDEFLAEVQGMPHRNLAIELLQRLLKDELKVRSRKYLAQSRAFSEMLEGSPLRRYQNRAIEAAQVIEELIQLAKEMREANRRGENAGLHEDELTFYNALEVNDSAVQVLDDDTLKTIAREFVEGVRNSATIDWPVKESVRAKMCVMVRRILRKYGYPHDKHEKATQTVLEQAELLCAGWAP
jgi:type I restriction enzyme R subunit